MQREKGRARLGRRIRRNLGAISRSKVEVSTMAKVEVSTMAEPVSKTEKKNKKKSWCDLKV